MKNHFAVHFFDNETGTTAMEYGLVCALISVVCIGGMTLVGAALQTTIYSLVSALILPAL